MGGEGGVHPHRLHDSCPDDRWRLGMAAMRRLSRAHIVSRFTVALKTLPKGTIMRARSKHVIESDENCKMIAEALAALVDGDHSCVVVPDMRHPSGNGTPEMGRFGQHEPWPAEIDWP